METILKLCFFALGSACALGISQEDSVHLNLPLPLHFEEGDKKLDLGFALQDSFFTWRGSQTETRNVVLADAKMRFSLDAFEFKTKVRVATEWTTAPLFLHPYEPLLGMPFNVQSKSDAGSFGRKTWDFLTARSQWNASWVSAGFAFDYLQTGPGVRTHLMWSGDQNLLRPWYFGDSLAHQTMPMLYGFWDLPFKMLRYRQWSGSLRTLKQEDKFFHSQRLDTRLGNLNLGFTQSVAYGTLLPSVDLLEAPYPTDKRTFQWIYALPFMPYYFTQHILGDRDNTLMSFDGDYQLGDLRFYGELLLDDLKSPTELLKDDWWGNKFGALAGAEWSHQWGSHRIRWNAEHTHLEPWVYTHRYGRGLNWEHYGNGLGADLGPNSRESWMQLSLECPKMGVFQAQALYAEKGQDLGSKLSDIHYTWNPTNKVYLNPLSSINYTQWGLAWSLPLAPYASLKLQGDYLKGYKEGWLFAFALRSSL